MPLRDRPATVSLNRGVDAPNAYLRSVAFALSRTQEEHQVFVGVDTHKDTLAVALIDPSGRRQEAVTVANTVAGHGQLVKWLTERGSVQRLGIEGAGGYGRAVALTALRH